MDFLEYDYHQACQNSKAMEMMQGVADVQDMEKSFSGYLNYARAHFPAMYALETHDWKNAEALAPPAGAEPYNQAITYWARAIGAGHQRDAAAAGDALARDEAMLEATRAS